MKAPAKSIQGELLHARILAGIEDLLARIHSQREKRKRLQHHPKTSLRRSKNSHR